MNKLELAKAKRLRKAAKRGASRYALVNAWRQHGWTLSVVDQLSQLATAN